MMPSMLINVLYLALIVHIGLIGIALWRVWRGDLTGILTLAILVLVSLIKQNSIYIDVALGLAALGFISTIALAKYIADEQMF